MREGQQTVCVERSSYTDILSGIQPRQYYLAKAALTELSQDLVRRHVCYGDEVVYNT